MVFVVVDLKYDSYISTSSRNSDITEVNDASEMASWKDARNMYDFFSVLLEVTEVRISSTILLRISVTRDSACSWNLHSW